MHVFLSKNRVGRLLSLRAGCARIRGRDFVTICHGKIIVSCMACFEFCVGPTNAVAQIREHNAHSDTQGRVPIKII